MPVAFQTGHDLEVSHAGQMLVINVTIKGLCFMSPTCFSALEGPRCLPATLHTVDIARTQGLKDQCKRGRNASTRDLHGPVKLTAQTVLG